MFTKLAIFACLMAVANAGAIGYSFQPAAITSTQDNILRTPGNLAQISTQSKSIQTPFSSSSKYQTQVSNPALIAHTAPIYAAAPAAPLTSYNYAAAVPAPIAPVAKIATAAALPPTSLLGVAYSPAVAVSHMTYSSPYGVYSY